MHKFVHGWDSATGGWLASPTPNQRGGRWVGKGGWPCPLVKLLVKLPVELSGEGTICILAYYYIG